MKLTKLKRKTKKALTAIARANYDQKRKRNKANTCVGNFLHVHLEFTGEEQERAGEERCSRVVWVELLRGNRSEERSQSNKPLPYWLSGL